MQSSEITEQLLRNDCDSKKFHTFGYAKIFAKRANTYGGILSFLTKIGFILPAVIGAVVLGYGIDYPALKIFVYLAIPLTVIQFVFSLWATLSGWNEVYAYALEASSHYNTLNSKYKNLAVFSAISLEDLKTRYDQLELEFDFRTQQDAKQNIKDWERRFGMRTSLREYQNKCVGCEITPRNHKSTDCDVCGQFTIKNRILNQ
jgi:mobilome CxxCx(11)CxxC protein